MQTTCPHCQTVFNVADEHLKVADGFVRCGICKEVFNALEQDQLEDKKEAAIQTETTTSLETPVEKVTEPGNTDSVEFILEQSNEVSTTEDQYSLLASDNISDQEEETTDSNDDAQSDLFSTPLETKEPEAIVTSDEATQVDAEETERTESETLHTEATASEIKIEAQEETSNNTDDDTTDHTVEATPVVIAEAASGANVSSTTETEKITEQPNEAVDNNLFDGVQSKLIPDEYRIPELHKANSLWQDLAWSMAILILTASLFVEYAWFNRNELISNPQLRPLVTQLCAITNCDAMDLREPSEIEMTTRNIYTHPNVKNALMISGTLINHAEFDQPYPNILIDFSNVRGEVIASRTFTPEDYLQIKITSLRPLPPRIPIDFNMEIQDPGKHAMTYEFSFL